jgi:hypothetical protein
MNILVTESQYNRVVLNEQSDGKVLFSDPNIEIVAYGMDSKSNTYILPNSNGKIRITNMNNRSPIIVNIEKSSPIFDLFDGSKKYSRQILPEDYDVVYLDFNKSIGEGKRTFTGNLTFVYTIQGKAPVLKSINIPFLRVGTVKGEEIKKQNYIYYNCKTKYNSNLLKSAVDWWRKWLNNPSTKDRFAKSFKYDKSTVEEHFVEYNNILSQIPMEYVISDKPNGGWVRPGRFFSNGYDIPIFINCRVANNYDANRALSLLIHEIQHILNDYHKFHPYEDQSYSDDGSSEDNASSPSKNNVTVLKKFLMTQGFDENASSEISDTYLWQLKNDEVHLRHPNEVMSTLSEIRRYLKLKPDQKITKEMIINSVNGKTDIDFDVLTFLSQWIYSKKRLSDFLNFSNSIAMGKPNTTDRNLA